MTSKTFSYLYHYKLFKHERQAASFCEVNEAILVNLIFLM